MTEKTSSNSLPEPKWPSPMQGERRIPLRRAVWLLTPHWLKRSSRR